MSVENVNVIDAISLDKDKNVCLTISDHLEWDTKNNHLLILQNKINTYLGAIENGELYKNYPKAKGKKIIFNIIAMHSPNEDGKIFLDKTKKILNDAGYELDFRHLP